MKTPATFLIVSLVLLLGALGALVYVWYIYQDTRRVETRSAPLETPVPKENVAPSRTNH